MTVYLLIGPSPYILCDSLFLKDKYFLSCVRVSHNSCQNNLVVFAFLSLSFSSLEHSFSFTRMYIYKIAILKTPNKLFAMFCI